VVPRRRRPLRAAAPPPARRPPASSAPKGSGADSVNACGRRCDDARRAAAGKPDGKKVFDTTCTACHTPGVAGAPKFGDKKDWAPRLAHGVDALYATALKEKGAMPPKGGNTALSDSEVKAAVDYMVARPPSKSRVRDDFLLPKRKWTRRESRL
jgi:cytochrome c5